MSHPFCSCGHSESSCCVTAREKVAADRALLATMAATIYAQIEHRYSAGAAMDRTPSDDAVYAARLILAEVDRG